MRKITGLLAVMLLVSAQVRPEDTKQQERNNSGTGGTVTAVIDAAGVVKVNGDGGGTKYKADETVTVEDVNVAKFRFNIPRPVAPPPPVVQPPPPPPPPAPVPLGNITVITDYAGAVMINGVAVGPRLKAGGTMNILNVRAGTVEVALKGDDGNIVQTPQTVMLPQGQTVSVAFKAPPPPPPPPVAEPEPEPKPVREPKPAPEPPPAAQPIRPVPETFIFIKGGTFKMGSLITEIGRYDDEEPQHEVTVGDFYMEMHEMIQGEYQFIMGTNPSHFKGYNLPVENVSWYDAIEYCNKRSRKEELTPAYTIDGTNVTWNRNANGYRLPTEAEWEYVCRARTMTPFSTGQKITTKQANYNGNYPYSSSGGAEFRENTTPVGNFAPNPWGLYDMHGNIWEWCWDWYGDYTNRPQTDPAGASSGINRVNRGGSWFNYIRTVRSANRSNNHPSTKSNTIGFRLARNAQ